MRCLRSSLSSRTLVAEESSASYTHLDVLEGITVSCETKANSRVANAGRTLEVLTTIGMGYYVNVLSRPSLFIPHNLIVQSPLDLATTK